MSEEQKRNVLTRMARVLLLAACAVLLVSCTGPSHHSPDSGGDRTMGAPTDMSSLQIQRQGMRLALDPDTGVVRLHARQAEWLLRGAGMSGFGHLSDDAGRVYVLGGSPSEPQLPVPIVWQRETRYRLVGRGSLPLLNVACEITYALEKGRKLRCALVLEGPGAAEIQYVRFPFAPSVDSPESRLVFPQWLGLLVSPEGEDIRVPRRLYERPWSMRFLGATQGVQDNGRSYIAILDDSLYRFADVWRHNGRAGYDIMGERSWAEGQSQRREQAITFEFLDGDYVQIAKRYRDWASQRPEWRTLATRERPCDPQRVGGAITFAHVPCDYGGVAIPFEDFIPRLRALKDAGVERAIFHLGGWNRLGYDSEYPDVFPANPKCGGDEGMRALTAVIDELGYVCTPHDDLGVISSQAPSYDEVWVAQYPGEVLIKGGIYREQQYYMANGKAQNHFAERNMPEFAQRYPRVRGYLFDVTTSVRPLEDYSETPPVPKVEDLARRNTIFAIARREFAEFITCESIVDWAIESLDSAYMAEEGTIHRGDGGWALDALHGEIVPLWELVPHDTMIGIQESTTHVNTPMDTEDPLVRYLRILLKTLRAGTLPPAFYSDDLRLGILESYRAGSQTDCGGWTGLGTIPLLATVSRLSTWLADRVFVTPMTDHAFPDGNLFHERTVFESKEGETVVYVNTDAEDPWSPLPGVTLAPLGFWIEGPGLLAYHAQEVAGVRCDTPVLVAVRGTRRPGGTVDVFRAFGQEQVIVSLEGGGVGVLEVPEACRTVSVSIEAMPSASAR